MTVQELIGMLLEFPQDDEVQVADDSGNLHDIKAVFHASAYGLHNVVIDA